ncbi:antirestriction protein [Dyella sp. ASV21]|uniref:antirestriction protein n=1 Tax=Dyella sp. ASV21 TaxID=2795114 RepID=UPI0018EDF897|nr:antirestriction protein [Dyella sp. ASV21]
MSDEIEERVTATVVPDEKRLAFLPEKLPGAYLKFENTCYAVLDTQAADYHGGMWNFYDLSNGGFYIAPADYETLHIEVMTNGYEGTMSGDAAGIVASLCAINHLCWRQPSEHHNRMFYALRDFARQHAESAAIFGAID